MMGLPKYQSCCRDIRGIGHHSDLSFSWISVGDRLSINPGGTEPWILACLLPPQGSWLFQLGQYHNPLGTSSDSRNAGSTTLPNLVRRLFSRTSRLLQHFTAHDITQSI
ncbi:hypothetical protein SAMD00023353_0105230 [Rosellinia necatrix]|uniref:Uncharacterized protein n=1 Tax=Rosellinia necatrix TaxID=77044 RepID=A0A1S8A4V2_ROSNE|nr:hypothetical protein SAMD00023353_0105230 [Rosellinia necatrix]